MIKMHHSYMSTANRTLTLSLPSKLAALMEKRVRLLDTDRSKYIRSLVRKDLEAAKSKQEAAQ